MSDTAYSAPTDDDDDDDTGEAQGSQDGAIPTEDDTEPTPASMQDQQGEQQDQDQGPVPGAAQSAGTGLSELYALVRAVSQYGLKMAQQGDQGGQQAQSFEAGGLVLGFEDGGTVPPPDPDEPAQQDDDTTGAIPTAQPEQPKTETEQGFDTREKALDKSGLGGAFGAAQHQKIDAARQNYQSGLGGNTASPGGDHDFSGSPEPTQQSAGFTPPHQAMQNTMGKLMKYLQGDRAMDANTTSAIAYAVDPNGNLPPVEKKMKMVQYAYQKGLTETQDPAKAMDMALGVLQHQRKEYDMWRTAAAVKMGQNDVGSAIEAANKAFQAPFGDNVHFQQSAGGGITATVTDDKGNVQGQFPMQAPQFHDLMAKQGKFDNLVSNGIFETLSGLSAGAQAPGGAPAPQRAQGNTVGPSPQAQPYREQPRDLPILQAPKGTSQETFDQSKRIFPWVSQNSTREAWVAGQQQQDKDRGAKVQAAQTSNDARMARTQATQQGAMDRTRERDDASMDRTKLREDKHDVRFDKGWENRTQAAIIKQAGQNRSDPSATRKTAIAKSLLAEHTGDPEGYKAALKQYGIDYDRDILGQGAAPGAGGSPVPGAPKPAQPASAPGGAGGKPQAPGTSPGGQWVRNKATGAVEWRAASGG